jgi:hypothetical protein
MGTGIAPTFREMPDSVLERWRLIRRFAENWRHISLKVESDVLVPPLPRNPYAREYPSSFLEWFRFCHALKAAGSMLLHGGDNVVTEAIPGHDAVSLIFGGEGDCYWGVVYSDLRLDDPPVHRFGPCGESQSDGFEDRGVVSGSITEFVLLKLAYRVFPAAWIPTAPVTEERVKQMLLEFESHAMLGGLRIFESPSVAAFVKQDGRIIIGMEKSLPKSDLPTSVAELLW